jgi:hypothetical protein
MSKKIYKKCGSNIIEWLKVLLFICLFLTFSSIIWAQERQPKTIYLKDTTINLSYNVDQWLWQFSKTKNNIPQQVLIQFYDLPTAELKTKMRSDGIELLSYIPANAFFAIIFPYSNINVLKTEKIASIVNIKTQWKADKYLWQNSKISADAIKVVISFFKSISKAEIEKFILDHKGIIDNNELEFFGAYRVTIDAKKLKEIADWYGVEYISPAYEIVPLDAETNATHKSNIVTAPMTFGGAGLTGEGVTVGVGDNTSGIVHVDLKDRTINYNPYPYEYHGVHTSGTVGSAGIIDLKGEGISPHSIIVNHLYSSIWEETPALFSAHNMTVTNNSYAATVGNCNYAGIYDVTSAALDKMSLQYPVLHVFAAGNDALLNCSPFPTGFATISGGYQPAKNNIVVGSIDRYYKNKEVWGSSGPMKDGRMKPEISAVGAWVYAPTRTEEYLSTLGTSMASPQIAGALALLTERYRQINGSGDPRTDVLKAILLNGATDVETPGPDYTNGFGALNVNRSLQILNNSQYASKTVANGLQQNTAVVVPANTAQLKVMLYWHDVAASPVAGVALVNDLDLEVQEPSGSIRKPLVLDPGPGNVKNLAIEKADHLNNCEQVTVDDPAPGNYSAFVKGFSVPSGTQDYVLVYDFVPKGIQITNPISGIAVKANDSLLVYWDASSDVNSFTLQYSTNNGSNWNTIDNNISADQRFYVWMVPNLSSGLCKMRLTRNSTAEVSTSGTFVINSQPIVNFDAIQCPGYIRIKWNAIPNASAYEILRKRGPFMEIEDTVAVTNYTFNALSLDSFYYVAVRPIINGLSGYRSIAVRRQPNDGSCAGNISDGDLMIERLETPISGRQFTSSALSNNETLTLKIRNLDDAVCTQYKVSYSIDGGAWQSQNVFNSIPPNSSIPVAIPGLNLSALGTYQLRTAVENLSFVDPVKKNDSIVKTIQNLKNDLVSLSPIFVDDFENISPLTSIVDSFGISPNAHWDYYHSTDTGRFRSFVNSNITIDGNRSISLDAYKNIEVVNLNEFIGTFNLNNYNAGADEVRLEFSYLLHGIPRHIDSNEVWVRGKDTDVWQHLFYYNRDILKQGKILNSGSLSVTDALHNNSQTFSTSFQVKFGQFDTSCISLKDYGNGLTLDDVKLYTVQNDMQLTSIVSPKNVECGLIGMVPLTVKVYNSVYQTQSNVRIFYQLDNGNTISEEIPSISGKDTIEYTFNQKMDFTKQGAHTLNIWVAANGDTYLKNDSILNYIIHNQPLISSYPYKEDFEANDGYWYSEGLRNSWEYGTPNATKINRAASGTKAWKTDLTGNYNNLENSYLYSPCFDLSSLRSPYFTCNLALDIENCGFVLCDEAYMEYSVDDITWTKLGTGTQGVNWYNDTVHNVWSIQDNTTWHVAATDLPKGLQTIRLRYVFKSDPGSNFEGIAVDDVEIFDKIQPGKLVSVFPNPNHDGKININWNGTEGVEMQLAITDLLGREVYRTSVISTYPFNKTVIQTPRFASGVYLMHFIIDGNKFNYKLVYQ